jgi:GNAT superfamily N-acetyltransferase
MVRDYKDIDKYRISFNKLAHETFGIDFEKWYRMGFWDDRYVCYSYEDNDQIIANISITRTDLVICGKKIDAMQIGTVMTHPLYRHRGLARMLMEAVIGEYDSRCDVMFLFGLNNLYDFYTGFEFAPLNENHFYANVTIGNNIPKGSRRLCMSDANDIDLLNRLSMNRPPVSHILGAEKDESILKWHCLNNFPDDTYYLKEADAVVICRLSGGVFNIFDVAAHKKPDMQDVLKAFLPEGTYEVVFHFTPETDNIDIKSRPVTDEDYTFFFRSKKVQPEAGSFFPCTSRT